MLVYTWLLSGDDVSCFLSEGELTLGEVDGRGFHVSASSGGTLLEKFLVKQLH